MCDETGQYLAVSRVGQVNESVACKQVINVESSLISSESQAKLPKVVTSYNQSTEISCVKLTGSLLFTKIGNWLIVLQHFIHHFICSNCSYWRETASGITSRTSHRSTLWVIEGQVTSAVRNHKCNQSHDPMSQQLRQITGPFTNQVRSLP